MEERISGHTGLLALIGSPVGHSGSPAMYNYSFAKLGLDYAYVAFDVKEDQVKEAANQIGVHHTTVYKWLSTYRKNRSILALIPKSRGWQKNKPRLPSKLEVLIQETIEKQYLSHQKLSIAEIHSIIEQQCNLLDIHKPHEATVRRKINAISNFVKVKRREGRKAADDQYGKAAYEFPFADFPLSHIQIDHTKMDIEIVDDEHRLSI